MIFLEYFVFIKILLKLPLNHRLSVRLVLDLELLCGLLDSIELVIHNFEHAIECLVPLLLLLLGVLVLQLDHFVDLLLS